MKELSLTSRKWLKSFHIFQDPIYLRNKLLNIIFGLIQGLSVTGLVFFSVLKPWGKRS